jgi:hypothetical protein
MADDDSDVPEENDAGVGASVPTVGLDPADADVEVPEAADSSVGSGDDVAEVVPASSAAAAILLSGADALLMLQ